MTVNELINYLIHQNGDLDVYVQGYEGGLTDIELTSIKHVDVVRDYHSRNEEEKEWWNGDHEYANSLNRIPGLEVRKGIVISR